MSTLFYTALCFSIPGVIIVAVHFLGLGVRALMNKLKAINGGCQHDQ